MKKQTTAKPKKLRLDPEKIRELTPVTLEAVAGGQAVPTCRHSVLLA